MAEKVNIRRAGLEDYEAVMNIGKIYHGRDYLPARYDKYLKMFNCWVAEIQGEVVGFVGDRLMDGGITLTTVAARVKESYQGQGILGAMLKNVYDSYKNVESIKYEAMTTNNINMEQNGDRLRKRYKQTLERGLLEMAAKITDFDPSAVGTDEPDDVIQLTEKDLEAIFKSEDTCSRLFPAGRIIPDWYPYRLLPANIPLMFDGRCFWGTKNAEGGYTTLTTTDKFHHDSVLTFKLCIYGSNTHDIKQHVLKHVHNLSRLLQGKTYTSMMLHMTYSLDCEDFQEVTSIFEKCGIKISQDYYNRMILLEREL